MLISEKRKLDLAEAGGKVNRGGAARLVQFSGIMRGFRACSGIDIRCACPPKVAEAIAEGISGR
jgi:hypothetical protein